MPDSETPKVGRRVRHPRYGFELPMGKLCCHLDRSGETFELSNTENDYA